MTVIDLIIELQKIEDKNKEVLLDFTKPGMEIFKLMGIHDVSEIEAEGENFVMLSGMDYGQSNN